MVTKKLTLFERFPEIANEWHPTKNGKLTPLDLAGGSDRIVWWKCPKGKDHEWQTSPNKRTSRGDGCTICSGKKIVKSNSLETLFPKIAKEWHPSKNGALTPNIVGRGTNKIVWWRCSESPKHQWQANISNRTGLGNGCPFCSHNERGDRRGAAKIDKSISVLFPTIAKTWDYKKNITGTPNNIYPGSQKKYFWLCEKGHQSFKMSVLNRIKSKIGCPICTKNKKISDILKAPPGKSIGDIYPSLILEWNFEKNIPYSPFDINSNSHKKFWWNCPINCKHVYQAYRTDKIGKCPFCLGRKVNETNSLSTLSPEIAKEWHEEKNGQLTAHDVSLNSHKMAWWQCQMNPKHIWKSSIANRQK